MINWELNTVCFNLGNQCPIWILNEFTCQSFAYSKSN